MRSRKSSRCRNTPIGPTKTICRKISRPPTNLSRSDASIPTRFSELTVKPAAPLLLVFCLCTFSGAALAQQEIVTLATRPGVTQSFFLTSVPQELRAVAILLPGSGGLINLRSENGQPKFGQGNFLVRSRAQFIKNGAVAAILDAPSDHQIGWGMTDEFRLGEQHYADLSAVIDNLAKRYPDKPIFLVWTSRAHIFYSAVRHA